MLSKLTVLIGITAAIAGLATGEKVAKITLCTEKNFKGDCLTFMPVEGHCYEMEGKWNDSISSATYKGDPGLAFLYKNPGCPPNDQLPDFTAVSDVNDFPDLSTNHEGDFDNILSSVKLFLY